MTKAFGATSCQSDSAEILSRVNAMNTAFEKGDAKTIVDMTDPALFDISGGKEKALSMTKQVMDQIVKSGLIIEKLMVGKLTKTYMAATKSVCFVPKEVIMSIKGVRGRSVSYLVAINRNTANSPWLFLDSAGLQKKPELLWTLVPGLPKDIKLPPNHTELIQ
jgi:hypothetical protein